ncbi:pentatricopeptide repeat-containing protein At4g04790, mitochondrial [Hevea brasiliensis]|uniref:pentatricopeptide repeat-containing protein At4g04790, mitochondrial n=1 Tax=Hevea brasiliensis TaxID=3981 RepID=UPI0025FB6B2E|nr:pentatricopeptide repeat-containing protein At4g04790, mitochondrial [Hevea brasiliensis]
MRKLKNLSSLFGSSLKAKAKAKAAATSTAATTTTVKTSQGMDTALKHYVSSLDISSPSISHSITKGSVKFPKPPLDPINAPSLSVLSAIPILNAEDSGSDYEEDTKQLALEISSILAGDASVASPDLQRTSRKTSLENKLEIPWVPNFHTEIRSERRKEVSRKRKDTWIFKSTQGNRFDRLVKLCAQTLGVRATMVAFGKLGRENGVKEYNALIEICINKARESDDEDFALEYISRAFKLMKLMKEQGFQLENETYGPFLMYIIDMGMVEEFNFFCKFIKEDNPSSLGRLGYYEMLLHARVNNKEKIQELCNHISNNHSNETITLQENYLLALCETEQKNELLQLLEIIDITKVSSLDHAVSIFKSLGRLMLEPLAEKFLLEFKECDYGIENISTLIFSYATSIPNLAVEDVILKFKNMHSVLEIAPALKLYEKLIIFCCDSHKVHAALDVVDQICREGLTLSIDMLNSILLASEASFEFNLGQRIYSLVRHHNLIPNCETFRSMISLRAKMKDFGGAYDLLDDLKKLKLTPTASMYNAIMAVYFREKNINGALAVFKKMKLAGVKPDSQTYSYLIVNCDNEDQIIKYHEELKIAGISVSKQIYMALINAYATCGQFEKAKQVLSDERIPLKNFNEIKSVLVSALASHGQLDDALGLYEEIKNAGNSLEPKSVICLIDHLQSEGEISRLLKLLEELQDPDYWVDGCCRVIMYCMRNKHISSAVNLLKQLKDRISSDELVMQVLFDEVFSLFAETQPMELHMGLELLQAIKDELCVCPSRKSLDFLLSACGRAKDLHNSLSIWKEYEAAGYPYNVTSYLRMYQALLASGDQKSAKLMLAKIPKYDLHVCLIIQACQKTYIGSNSTKGKKKKKNKEKTNEKKNKNNQEKESIVK